MRSWLLSGFALAAVATAASAQTQTVVPGREGPILPPLLTKLDWNPSARGTLLVIAPETVPGNVVTPERPAGLPREAIVRRRLMRAEDVPPPNGPGYSLLTLEKYVDRKAMPVGSVTVFAPKTMDVLNWQRLPEPSATAGLTRAAKVRLWEASLTDAQWKKYASPGGIGVADLDRDQAKLFLGTLPTNAGLEQVERADGRGFMRRHPAKPLTDAQRKSLRRTLHRRLSWNLLMSDGAQFSFSDMEDGWTLTHTYHSDDTEGMSGKYIGQTLRAWVPNRLKPGHIDFANAALSVPVNLAGAKTVGDLVKRCSDTVRVPIHCDPRYAGLSVYTRGDSARAGDLLKAIALGVTGTYRKVGADYVLTDDIVPLGTRLAVIQEWIDANSSRTLALVSEADKRIAGRTDEVTQWAGNGERPDDTLLEGIEAQKKRERELWTEADRADPSRRLLQVPLEKVPAAARQRIADRLDKQVSFDGSMTFRKDVVVPQIRIERGYFLPGFGAIRDLTSGGGLPDSFGAFQPPHPTTADPAPLPRRQVTAVMVDVVDPADAEKKVALAAKAGFDAVWVAVPAGAKGILERAVEIGKRDRIAVHAAVRLARTRDDSPDLDLTLMNETTRRWASRQVKLMGPPNLFDGSSTGRTILANQLLEKGDYLRIDRPTDRERWMAHLADAAKVPGLAGVVVLDWCPSRYLGTIWLDSGNFGHGVETGYSPELRLACLRAHAFDPADIGPGSDAFPPFASDLTEGFSPPSLGLRFFNTGNELDPLWRKMRTSVASSSFEALRAVKTAVPRLFMVTTGIGPWVGSFDKGTILFDSSTGLPAYEAADKVSTHRVEVYPYFHDPAIGESLESGVGRWTREVVPAMGPVRGEGRVYDLTELKGTDQEKVLGLLRVEPRN